MLTQWARARAGRILDAVARLFLRLGFTPNALTVTGFLISLVIAAAIAAGYESLGGVLLIGALLFDAVDGSAARLSQSVTPFGAFLDSTLDRWTEAALYLAILLRTLQNSDYSSTVLAFVAFAGSVMVSYTRARAEGIGVECKEGLLTRLERLALLILALVLSSIWGFTPVKIALVIIALFANLTAVQRLLTVRRKLEADAHTADLQPRH